MKRLVCLMAALTMACGLSSNAVNANELRIAGSTTVLPVSQVWAEALVSKNPNMQLTVSGGGSGSGLSMLMNGTCDIANSSRPARKAELDAAVAKNTKLVETKLAKDGIAIIVHPSNNVINLTIDQISNAFQGKVRTWDQIGGQSKGRILTIGRDSSSGTHGFFQEHVLKSNRYRRDMLSLASNAAIVHAVSQSPGSIGYVGLAFAEDAQKANKVKILSVSLKTGERGLRPTEASVRDGSYPIFRFLYAYTLGEPKGAAADYLNFGLSNEGKNLVKRVGYLPIK